MLSFVVSLLGSFFGYLIARFTKEELKAGSFYFNILELVLLLIIPFVFLYYSFNIILFIIGVVTGVFFRFEYFYFGVGLISSLNNFNLNFLLSSLVFIYGLAYGSLSFIAKNFKILFYNVILFIVPFLLYFFNCDFLSFGAGGLLSLFIIKFGRFFKRFN